jgi:hypothetical protein
MVEGTEWGDDLIPVETMPVLGTNLVYSFHAYNGSATVYPPVLDSQIAPLLDPAGSFRYAGYLSEFGTTEQDVYGNLDYGSQYLRSVINWAYAHGVGWTVWGWFPTWYAHFGMLVTYEPLRLTSRAQTVVYRF